MMSLHVHAQRSQACKTIVSGLHFFPLIAGTSSGSTSQGDAADGVDYWLQGSVHSKLQKHRRFKPLTAKQVQGVEKFLFFTGYPRSGHSIVGSFLDAHPHIALSFAFYLFRNLLKRRDEDGSLDGLMRNKTLFFNIIYERSYHYSLISKSNKKKGYSLDIPELWSGKFNGHLKVIGDKSALPTTLGYSNSSPAYFKERYNCLQRSTGIPLLGIHVVRNPFDMISTHLLYGSLNYSWKREDKEKWSATNKFTNESKLERLIEFFFDKAKAVQEMIPLCGMRILEVHNEDLVKDARKELNRMCEFLDVECPEEYLQKCESKSYRNVSRTRDKVFWPPDLRRKVEEGISMYSFFRGYSFEDDYYKGRRQGGGLGGL